MHRWHRDYNRSARVPTDFMRDAASYVAEVFFFVLAVAVLGIILMLFGVEAD